MATRPEYSPAKPPRRNTPAAEHGSVLKKVPLTECPEKHGVFYPRGYVIVSFKSMADAEAS
ncbi:MAG: hypothetical protein H0X69_15070 [Gemmatimonadales bacterium]|nr:hypothetical protein [Gemmatimonadales bacterium]